MKVKDFTEIREEQLWELEVDLSKRHKRNPGGRPKVLGDVQELSRRQCPEAINALATIIRNEKAPPAARVAAANALGARFGVGRPKIWARNVADASLSRDQTMV